MKHYFEDKILTFRGQFGTAILSLGDVTNFLVRKGSSDDVKWVVQAKVLEFRSNTMVIQCENETRKRILAYEDVVEVSDKCPA